MDYDSRRDAAQLEVLEVRLKAFTQAWKARQVPPGRPRRTVFVFPGGLASRLLRATVPYDEANDSPKTFDYKRCWATPEILVNGSATLLAMDKTAQGAWLDSNRQIIVADGAVGLDDVLGLPEEADSTSDGITPYSGFELLCDIKGIDCFMYGWDWRRSVEDVGRFFIEKFLPAFDAVMRDECGVASPAPFSLVGHSAGGMVVNWILRHLPDSPALERVVTVGTPFYGYAGQLHRWFEGDSLVNGFNGEFTQQIVRTVCRLPGCYAWNFAEEAIFANNQQAFGSDPDAPLLGYPSTDAVVANLVADPYNPQTSMQGGVALTRYLSDVGFDYDELAKAKAIVGELASALSPAQAAKFYNLRGMHSTFGGHGLLGDVGEWVEEVVDLVLPGDQSHFLVSKATVGTTRWHWVPGGTPTIIDEQQVPGDGVQPAWTARHLDLMNLPGDHVRTVRGPDMAHAGLMSAPTMLAALADVLNF